MGFLMCLIKSVTNKRSHVLNAQPATPYCVDLQYCATTRKNDHLN